MSLRELLHKTYPRLDIGKCLADDTKRCDYGETYLVKDGNNEMVIKLIKCNTDRFAKDVYRTYERIMELQHPNIVHIIALKLIKIPIPVIIITMQYYPEGNIKTIKVKNLSLGEIKHYLLEIFNGINFIHEELHMIHKNLKPSNIFVHENHLVISDISLSCYDNLWASGYTWPSSYEWNDGFGRDLKYASPELTCGMLYARRTDIWSIGVILIRAFFDWDLNDMEKLTGKCILSFIALSDINKFKEILEQLPDIIALCLEPNPRKRLHAKDIILKIEAM